VFLLLQNSFSSCWFHSLTATEILDIFCKTDWVMMLYATFGKIWAKIWQSHGTRRVLRFYFTRYSPASSLAAFKLALPNYGSEGTDWRVNPSEW